MLKILNYNLAPDFESYVFSNSALFKLQKLIKFKNKISFKKFWPFIHKTRLNKKFEILQLFLFRNLIKQVEL
jgi:hypothetical protein